MQFQIFKFGCVKWAKVNGHVESDSTKASSSKMDQCSTHAIYKIGANMMTSNALCRTIIEVLNFFHAFLTVPPLSWSKAIRKLNVDKPKNEDERYFSKA
jgi:hypothetical protein